MKLEVSETIYFNRDTLGEIITAKSEILSEEQTTRLKGFLCSSLIPYS